MDEVSEKLNPLFFQSLVESEKYDILLFLIFSGIRKALLKKTSEIKVLKETLPSFKSEDMVRKGELQQLKTELVEFIEQIQDVLEINFSDELTQRSIY